MIAPTPSEKQANGSERFLRRNLRCSRARSPRDTRGQQVRHNGETPLTYKSATTVGKLQTSEHTKCHNRAEKSISTRSSELSRASHGLTPREWQPEASEAINQAGSNRFQGSEPTSAATARSWGSASARAAPVISQKHDRRALRITSRRTLTMMISTAKHPDIAADV